MISEVLLLNNEYKTTKDKINLWGAENLKKKYFVTFWEVGYAESFSVFPC